MPFASASWSTRRASRRPDQLDAADTAGPFEPRLEPGIVDRLHRGHRGPDAEGEEQDREFHRAEVHPDEQDGLAGHDRLGDEFRGIERQSLVHPRPGDGRRAGHLQVVAGVVAEGGSDEPFERARVGRGGTDAGAATSVGGKGLADPTQVAPGLGGALRRQPVPQVAGELGQAEQRALRQPAGEPRGRDEGPAADP